VCQRPHVLVLEDRLPLGDTVGGVLAWSVLGPSAFTPPTGPALVARRDGFSDFGTNRVQPLGATRVALIDVAVAAEGWCGQGSHNATTGQDSQRGSPEPTAQGARPNEPLWDLLPPSQTAAKHCLTHGRDAGIAEAQPPAGARAAPAAEPAVGAARQGGTASPA